MQERTQPPSVDNLAEARRAIEAMLLVANDPTPVQLLAQLVELPVDLVQSMCRELAGEYEAQRRGFQLVEVAGGWRFQTHPDTHAYVERFALEGIPNRLSSAALETLAIVAYKQPISRAQVGAIRGVNVDGVLRTLVQRGYVDEQGRDAGPGQAALFGTTPFFLEQLGLMSLDDLPPLGDFVPSVEVLEALENTLRVDPEPEIVIDDTPEAITTPPEAEETVEVETEVEEAVEEQPAPVDVGPGIHDVAGNGPNGSSNGHGNGSTNGAIVTSDEDADDEAVYEVIGDPAASVIPLSVPPLDDTNGDDPTEAEFDPEGGDDPDAPVDPDAAVEVDSADAAGRVEPGTSPEPVATATIGDAVQAEARQEHTEGDRLDPVPSDELEVTADPEVEMTDGPTGTGAAGADDARFPGPGAAPSPDPANRTDPGQGPGGWLGPGPAGEASQHPTPPQHSPPWPKTLNNGHRADPESGDA